MYWRYTVLCQVYSVYSSIQVDDPSQKHQSRAGSGPEFTWNDSFNVELGPASCEVLFEVIQCYVCCELN